MTTGSTLSFDINPLSPALGAEISGIDVATISDADFAAIQADARVAVNLSVL